jgi:hypothetical protein
LFVLCPDRVSVRMYRADDRQVSTPTHWFSRLSRFTATSIG